MGDKNGVQILLFFSVLAVQLTQSVFAQVTISNYLTTLKPIASYSLSLSNVSKTEKMTNSNLNSHPVNGKYSSDNFRNVNSSDYSDYDYSKDILKHCCRQSFYDKIIDTYHKTKARKGEKYTIDILHSPFSLDSKILETNKHSETMKGEDIIVSHFQKEDINYLKNYTVNGLQINKHYKTYHHSNHIFINIQFLPYSECLTIYRKCLNPKVIIAAAKMALRKNPPPVGVTLIVRPPPEGK